jgi:hypothetical protein
MTLHLLNTIRRQRSAPQLLLLVHDRRHKCKYKPPCLNAVKMQDGKEFRERNIATKIEWNVKLSKPIDDKW